MVYPPHSSQSTKKKKPAVTQGGTLSIATASSIDASSSDTVFNQAGIPKIAVLF
jgi:hypothetical protein